MDNIEEMLRALTEDDSEDISADSETQEEQSEGLFSGLDPEVLIKMFALFEALNQPNDSERFLLALKPLLREENRSKIDSAIRLMKLFTLLPLLKDGHRLHPVLRLNDVVGVLEHGAQDGAVHFGVVGHQYRIALLFFWTHSAIPLLLISRPDYVRAQT